jgi:hypothetical protein
MVPLLVHILDDINHLGPNSCTTWCCSKGWMWSWKDMFVTWLVWMETSSRYF